MSSSANLHQFGQSLEADIDRVLRDVKRGVVSDAPAFVPTPAPNITERIDTEVAAWDAQRDAADTTFKRGDRVRYIGDTAFKGVEGRVRGIDRWGEERVDVDLETRTRHGNRLRVVRKLVAPENLEKIGAAS